MNVRSLLIHPSFGGVLVVALALVACGSGAGGDDANTPATSGALSTCQAECPNVCLALCNGEPIPEVPDGCPVPSCACDHPPDPPACPNVCSAICAGEAEPELPDGCPTPSCSCE